MGLLNSFKSPHVIPDKREFIQAGSIPAYPVSHVGSVCLVVGTHPCWHEDLFHALDIHEFADFCGVNEAGRLMDVNHLATCHTEKIDHFASLCRNKPILHVKDQDAKFSSVAYRWRMNMWAGSAMFAAMTMLAIGYDQVILCGCPMTGGGGYAFKDTHKSTPDDPRIGEMKQDHNVVKSWAQAMRQIKEELPDADRIRSMSGVTQKIFGGI